MRSQRDAFTLVEVMVALGIMTIGALALVGMQQQATRANVRARDITVAMQIAQNVIERFKMDALAWNANTGQPASDLINCPMLQPITSATPGAFTTMNAITATNAGTTVTLSNAFDYLGYDFSISGASAAALNQVRFCASQRLTWVYANGNAMRVDVRVWWSRESPTRSIITDFPNCADNNAALNPGGTMDGAYHVVYLSTVLRPT